MPQYKLIYFNLMGRAEMTRWLFAYGGIPYTDERIEKADWPAKKESLPYKKLPLLMIDDKPLPQSIAMARYVAKEVGLYPEDNLHAAYVDAMVDTLMDVMTAMRAITMSDKSEEEKKKQFQEEFFPNMLAPVLTRLNKRFGEKEWFIGDKISWADLAIAMAMGLLKKRKPEIFGNFSALSAHIEKVINLPKIKEWIAKRPVTET